MTRRSDGGKGTGFIAVVQSVLAAGIGVQSKADRERDFRHGRPTRFTGSGTPARRP